MEINDRNVLLQQFWGSQKSPMLSDVSMDGFADMLKADKVDIESKEGFDSFSVAKKINVSEAVEDKKVVFKKDGVAKKKQVEAPEKKDNSAQTKVDSNDKPEHVEDKEVEYVKKNNNSVTDTKELKSEDISSDCEHDIVGQQVESIEDVLVDSVEDFVYPSMVVPAFSVEYADSENIVAIENEIIPLDVDAVLPEDGFDVLPQDDSKIASVDSDVIDDPMLLEEDALLVEQSRYLDEKIRPTSKLKINVDVKEEKVAASITKDVIQNRFEVEDLFRSMTTEEAINQEVVSENIMDDVAIKDNKPVLNNQVFPIDNKAFVATTMSSSDNTVQHVVEASNLSVSGKEVVLDTINTAKIDMVNRLNETASKDAFKGLGKEVVEQIKINITKSAIKGVDTIDIQLKPEDLGKIQIKMHIAKDGKLQAEIISSRPETLEALQKDVSNLAKAFNDAGYEADSKSFNFSFQRENQAREQQKDASGLSQFIGDTFEQEADEVAGNDNLRYDPLLGLNIKV